MATKKVLRSYRISFEMDLEVAKVVAARAFEVPKVSQADVVEEFFMRGLRVPVRETRSLMDDETRFTLEEIAETQGMTVAGLLRLTFVETAQSTSSEDPSTLPAVETTPSPATVVIPSTLPRVENRVEREKRERRDRTQKLDSVDDPSIDRSDEYVSG